MADFQPNQSNGQHKCENCGALYEVMWGRLRIQLSDQEKCHCCGETMAEWNSIAFPIFKPIGECLGDENVRFIE